MKIAIAGYGIEGESNYRYWSADPQNEVVIVDENQPKCQLPDGVRTIISNDAFSNMQEFDLVVRTAGLAPRKIKTNGKIWSGTNEFFDKCPALIIGVTGSKGKSTTVSLIASILRQAGKKVWLIGNIGKPALDELTYINKDDYVVFELSSFQLWDIKKSPQIAVVLFIEQEHLNVHLDINEYVSAKANITKYQSSDDLLIFNKSNDYAQSIADLSSAKLIGYTDEKSAHVTDGNFYYGEQKICSVDTLKIVGKHHFDNACAAIDAIWQITNDTEVIKAGLSDFEGLPHRLQFVREVKGIKYYDDSIATTPSSSIAAIRSFDGPEVIILGGSSKGSDFTSLGLELTKHDVNAILIGDEAETISKSCLEAGFTNFVIIKNSEMSMMKIVELAQNMLLDNKNGGVVLLSPSSASFGLFKDYADRGDQFATAVRTL